MNWQDSLIHEGKKTFRTRAENKGGKVEWLQDDVELCETQRFNERVLDQKLSRSLKG